MACNAPPALRCPLGHRTSVPFDLPVSRRTTFAARQFEKSLVVCLQPLHPREGQTGRKAGAQSQGSSTGNRRRQPGCRRDVERRGSPRCEMITSGRASHFSAACRPSGVPRKRHFRTLTHTGEVTVFNFRGFGDCTAGEHGLAPVPQLTKPH